MKTLKEFKIGRYPPAVVVEKSTPIIKVIKGLAEKWVRHAPIVDENNRLIGMVSARDIIDFLGGGPKSRIVEEKYDGNLYEAIMKEPVNSIKYMPPYVTLDDDIQAVVSIMLERNIGALAITDEERRVVGIISERHIMALFSEAKTMVRVCELMSRPLITLPPQATLIEGQKLMHEKHIRRIPLKTGSNLRGIVSIKDVVKFYSLEETLERLRLLGKENVYDTPLSYLASTKVITVEPHVDLGEAIRIMRENNIGSLVVVDRGECTGIITERDFIIKLPKMWGVELFVDEVEELIVAGRIVVLR